MKSSVILIIDDDPGALAFLATAIEDRGATALVARSGESALAILERLTPDIILLDAVMPGLDGFEVCRRLKRDDRLAGVPVIFMTGLSDTDHVVQGFTVGGVDYVTKPIVVEQLLVRLSAHMATSRMALRARSALDASGRHLLATDRRGSVIWSTPKARSLLDLDMEDDDVTVSRRAAQLRALMPDGRANAQKEAIITTRAGVRIRILYLGLVSGDELLFCLTEADESGAEGALSRALSVTPRESEVLLWLSRGKSNADIAAILGLSPRTVDKHLEQIYKKMGVENRTAAVRMAIQIIERL
ncbi:DNA-binding response regulator [Methylosinus sp. R-45379]|jgi:DNA-binding NarL/FixJ family response regulator|uniref:response regulator transcription factor n=1 Tax=unclassified Methylosinus TaxID=2624500 RepID=UPI00055D1EA3|nr:MULTISPECIES: DNA-binding response regulator [unclassified Methylosinus]OAI25628.1 DNA-binding response regulator [Methylosinus sp. R-45379]TDX62493.1 LuxR family two component transcriptional regulator [Methylosinus sp. sav-2]